VQALGLRQVLAVQAFGHEHRRLGLAVVQDGERGKTDLAQLLAGGHRRRPRVGEELRTFRERGLHQRRVGRG